VEQVYRQLVVLIVPAGSSDCARRLDVKRNRLACEDLDGRLRAPCRHSTMWTAESFGMSKFGSARPIRPDAVHWRVLQRERDDETCSRLAVLGHGCIDEATQQVLVRSRRARRN